MSFFSKIATTVRAVNEGRATAAAHKMAEELLETNLPPDVAEAGYALAARIADFSSVEEMAMGYVTTYANRMHHYLDAVGATAEFRTKVARSLARACLILADMKRAGARFSDGHISNLTEAAQRHGLNMSAPRVSIFE